MRYSFAGYVLDTDAMELSGSGQVIPLEPQVFDLIRVLIAERVRVVSRDDLIASVWQGRIVSETTISARINAARRALGDDGSAQRVIKTVPRRGYRFVAHVVETVSYKGIEIPANDAERVAALKTYSILDTPPEAAFDNITAMAARISGCRFSYISFCDETRFWLKSTVGYPDGFTERARELSMCPATLLQSDLLVVDDMRTHPRYNNLPSIRNPPHTRFYCAMPLINPEGFALGTLCVWDPGRKKLDEGQRYLIQALARQLLTLLELRRRINDLESRQSELTDLVTRMRDLIER